MPDGRTGMRMRLADPARPCRGGPLPGAALEWRLLVALSLLVALFPSLSLRSPP